MNAQEASDLFRQEPPRFLDVGAGEVAYRSAGSGPDVLFVHGWPVSGATFRTLLPHLVDHVTCHIIDLPGAGSSRVAGRPRLRRNGFVLGDAFADSSLLDGEFDEFFLQPLNTSHKHRAAAIRLLRSFEKQHVVDLAAIHRCIDVPVQMVWGDQDPFFPLKWAKEMVGTFADAHLDVIPGAGLFSHEERPAEVAAALLPVLTDTR